MLRRIGALLARALLATVEATSGGARDDTSVRSELAQAALRATTTLIRACDWVRLSEEQLRALLHLAREDLPIVPRQGATFALLRAIITRRLVVPEI
jgi:U3 small nucleolar RNA-associated protein 20